MYMYLYISPISLLSISPYTTGQGMDIASKVVALLCSLNVAMQHQCATILISLTASKPDRYTGLKYSVLLQHMIMGGKILKIQPGFELGSVLPLIRHWSRRYA